MVLKEIFLTVSTLGVCGVLKITEFLQFLCWEGVVVLKELIYNSFNFGRVWWLCRNSLLTVSTLGRCGGLERTDLFTVSTIGGCGGLVKTHFNSFYIGWVWWS